MLIRPVHYPVIKFFISVLILLIFPFFFISSHHILTCPLSSLTLIRVFITETCNCGSNKIINRRELNDETDNKNKA
jgi:hypothetical protein